MTPAKKPAKDGPKRANDEDPNCLRQAGDAVEWCVRFDYDYSDIGGPFASAAEAESLLYLSGLPGAVFQRGGASGPNWIFARPDEATE